MVPGTLVTTLHFLCSLQMDPIISSVTLHWAGRLAIDKQSSLLR
jgi:hypothetical protein